MMTKVPADGPSVGYCDFCRDAGRRVYAEMARPESMEDWECACGRPDACVCNTERREL